MIGFTPLDRGHETEAVRWFFRKVVGYGTNNWYSLHPVTNKTSSPFILLNIVGGSAETEKASRLMDPTSKYAVVGRGCSYTGNVLRCDKWEGGYQYQLPVSPSVNDPDAFPDGDVRATPKNYCYRTVPATKPNIDKFCKTPRVIALNSTNGSGLCLESRTSGVVSYYFDGSGNCYVETPTAGGGTGAGSGGGGGGGGGGGSDDSADDELQKAEEERKRRAGIKFFETTKNLVLARLSDRQNYKFIAKLNDTDGAIDQNNNLVDGTSVFTSVRTLFDDIEDVRSADDQRPFSPPTNPGQMLRDLIDEASSASESFDIFYDSSSIKNVDYSAQYTFRDTQLRNCIDKIRTLCPSNWHWHVEASGRMILRGPQHTVTHVLRIGREIINYQNDRTIKNVKNIVVLKGRQDEDSSEADGQGSIRVEVKDEESINLYGARYLFLRDSNIKDIETARIVAQGRLEENNKVEEHGRIDVIDEKEILYLEDPIRGYNIESFQPGDFVKIINTGADRASSKMYWDRAFFNQAAWESGSLDIESEGVPIKKISYEGDQVKLELSERRPSATGDFEKLSRWQRLQEQNTSD